MKIGRRTIAVPVVVIILVVSITIILLRGRGPAETPFPGWTKEHGIFSVNLDGSGLTLIYQSDTPVDLPSVSPDGSKILLREFTNDINGDGKIDEGDAGSSEIGIVNIDGTGHMLLTNNTDDKIADMEAVWSPDGTKILFVSSRYQTGWGGDLYVMELENTENVMRLTETYNVMETSPHWVNDKIVFKRTDLAIENANSEIWIMNHDGSNLRRLTSPTIAGRSHTYNEFGDHTPKLSPDGTKVVFSRHLDDNLTVAGEVMGNWDLFVLNITTGAEDALTNTSNVAEVAPDWSPDGTMLVFQFLTQGVGGYPVMNSDGSGEREVVMRWQDPVKLKMPDWFPDGQKLIFAAEKF